MKCKEVVSLLEDYQYGELSMGLADQVRSHIAGCAECSRALGGLKVEDAVYQAYRDDLERRLSISPTLWHRLSARLTRGTEATAEPARGQGRLSELLEKIPVLMPRSPLARQAVVAAILIILSVSATLVTVEYFRGRDAKNLSVKVREQSTQEIEATVHPSEEPGFARVSRQAAGQKDLESALRSIQRAEREYMDAIRILSDIVDKRKATLDPRLVAELDANLKAIDENIAATRRAYHAHPTDPELAMYMLSAYSKKVELLQELAL